MPTDPESADLSPTEREAMSERLLHRWLDRHPSECGLMFHRGTETFIMPCEIPVFEYHEPEGFLGCPMGIQPHYAPITAESFDAAEGSGED